MRKTMRLTAAISLAAALALSLSAMAQERDHHQDRHQGGPPGRPGGPPGPPGAPPGPGPHGFHALGERGYSFRGSGGVRRDIAVFSPREREMWRGGRWHHEMRFGRMGYWYEVNGAWYFYDQPFDGPPAYVSEMEFMDPDLAVGPAPIVVAPAPVVVVPPPPPVVCIGPLCVR